MNSLARWIGVVGWEGEVVGEVVVVETSKENISGINSLILVLAISTPANIPDIDTWLLFSMYDESTPPF